MTNSKNVSKAKVKSPIILVLRPDMTLKEVEKTVILQVLQKNRQHRAKTARALSIGVRTLQRKIKHYRQQEESHEENKVTLGKPWLS